MPQLRYALLELTLRCNLRCVHCAAGAGSARPRELDEAVWREVVRDLAELGCGAVDLMGGEVLLSPLVQPVGEALQAAGLGWGILTNGWFLDRERARELRAWGCRGMGVSLDGATAETHDGMRGRAGSFARALGALEVVAEQDFKPVNRAVLTSVTRLNVDELEALGELLSARVPSFRWQINLASATAPRLSEEHRLDVAGQQRVVDFIRRARRDGTYDLQVTASHDVGYYEGGAHDLHAHDWHGCVAGIRNVGIQADGLVKGCLALEESYGVGNVGQTRLRDLWRDQALMRRYRDVTAADLGPGCQDCVWGAACRGGCLAASVALTGEPHNHPHCLWRRTPEDQRVEVVRPVEDLSELKWVDEGGGEDKDWPLPLLSACIELTHRCNLRCLHCGSAAGANRHAELELGELEDLFDDLEQLGCQRVALLGGEPLLYRDWEAAVALAGAAGLEVALVTNGLLVTARVAARLAALGVSRVGVSIDGGTDAVHDRIRGQAGARRKAWRAVGELQEAGLAVTVITTVSQLNIAELALLCEQTIDCGPDVLWQLQAANGTGERFAKDWMLRPDQVLGVARYVEAMRRAVGQESAAIAAGHNIGHHGCTVHDYATEGEWRGCPGGVMSVGVCSDGAVKGCLSMSASEVVGNIRQTRLWDLWLDPAPFAQRRVTAPGRLRGGCARCPHGSTCRAGCPEMARTATGDVWDNPLCVRQAELAEQAAQVELGAAL